MVSDEQIRQWVDEAEAGFDVAELKRRGRGRPGRGAEAAQVVAVRLTAEELKALDAAAERYDLSRSAVIRVALAKYVERDALDDALDRMEAEHGAVDEKDVEAIFARLSG